MFKLVLEALVSEAGGLFCFFSWRAQSGVFQDFTFLRKAPVLLILTTTVHSFHFLGGEKLCISLATEKRAQDLHVLRRYLLAFPTINGRFLQLVFSENMSKWSKTAARITPPKKWQQLHSEHVQDSNSALPYKVGPYDRYKWSYNPYKRPYKRVSLWI